jgi:hypothetical protein
MQIRDEALWQELVKELKNSDHGTALYDFVTGWCDRAEQVMGQGTGSDPADALRLTLFDTEEIYNRKNIWIIGQALVVICIHWGHGENASENFTEFEVRLIQDITAAKIAQLQAQAEEGNIPPE